MPIFTPTRSLLNPKFEGYRLDAEAQEDVVTRHELEFKLTQATVSSGRSPLSMQEVQSRITHNHLALLSEKGRALYVDAEFRVVVLDIDKVSIYCTGMLTLILFYSMLSQCKVDHAGAFCACCVRAPETHTDIQCPIP